VIIMWTKRMDLQFAKSTNPRLGLGARFAAVACFLLAAALLTFGQSGHLPGAANAEPAAIAAPHL
jgi:hypothetical protein